ncbi:MAG: thiol-activated cytolysin family protein [Bacteroidetes bacterium]|nr:thiol-activated cytolysin family protein [Bacteroidota bacterium]
MQEFSASFAPAAVVRNVNGVNVKYVAVKNPASTNNVSINTQPLQSQNSNGFLCTTTRESVSASSTSFMSINMSGQGIYPGAIYSYNDFMMGNTTKPIGEGKRNPITLTTDNNNTSGEVSMLVANLNPSEANINTAKQNIVKNFSTTATAANMQYQYNYTESAVAQAMATSGGGSILGFTIGAGLSTNKEDHHLYIMYDYIIPMYTVSTSIPTSGFFTDAILEKSPDLVWMSSVTYGTRILANIRIDENSLINSDFSNFKYGDKQNNSLNFDLEKLNQNKNIKYTINTYVVGTDVKALINATSVTDLNNFINSVLSHLSNQTAKPISYTLASMAGDVIGIQSNTDEYVVSNCVKQNSSFKLQSADVEIWTGRDNKVAGSKATVELYTNSSNPNVSPLNGRFVGSTMSNAEFAMGKGANLRISPDPNKNMGLLSEFQSGLNRLDVFFDPKQPDLILDEWDVATVKIKLNFVDINGGQYSPEYSFEMNNAKAHLMKNKQRLSCYFDASFKPTTSVQP